MAETPQEPIAGGASLVSTVNIRPPSTHTYKVVKETTVEATAPSFEWISGTWNVSYTTLPFWEDKQNVRITYAKVDPSADSTSKMPDLDDHVQYQKKGSTKDSSINGISRPVQVDGTPFGTVYSWRGKGWLRMISSDWEILGWGKDEGAEEPNDWVVTCFSKTLFTPAGVDIYTRTKSNLSSGTLEQIKKALEGLADDDWAKMVGGDKLFEIPRP